MGGSDGGRARWSLSQKRGLCCVYGGGSARNVVVEFMGGQQGRADARSW